MGGVVVRQIRSHFFNFFWGPFPLFSPLSMPSHTVWCAQLGAMRKLYFKNRNMFMIIIFQRKMLIGGALFAIH